jgi:hypothetical protein
MKTLKILLFLLALLFPPIAISAGNSMLVSQRAPDNSITNIWIMGPPTQDSLLRYNFATNLPDFMSVGSSGAQVIAAQTATDARTAIGAGSVTSVSAGTGLSGGTFTTSGTVSMPSTGTPGSYTNVTTDAQGRITAGTVPSINDSPGRSLVTATNATGYQVSASRISDVCYEGTFSLTSSIGGPAAITVFLETADTNSTTPADWTTKAQQPSSNTITLAVVLNQVAIGPWVLCRKIPAGKFVRIRSGSVTGTATASVNAEQQEVLL